MAALSVDDTIAVIGAGTMGAGIAQVAAAAGHRVYLFDSAPGAAVRGVDKITAALQRRVDSGKADQGEVDALIGRINPVDPSDGLVGLASASLIIEAIVENLEVKRALFEELDTVIGKDTILATNTSSLSITALARDIENPARVVGMHFFNPPPLMALVEVITGLQTSEEVAQTVSDTCVAWGKSPVFAKSTPAFIVNRVARPYYAEAYRAIEEGACDFATVDALIRESGGFRMGPFELMDLIGIDVNYAVTCSVFEAFYNDPRYRPSLLQREMVDGGLLGRKTGQGFFRYGDDREVPQPATAAPAPAPSNIEVCGDAGQLAPLLEKWSAAGIKVDFSEGDGRLRVDGINVAVTEGRPATELSAADDEPWVLVDLALDYSACTRVGIASCRQYPDSADVVAGLFQSAGKAVSVIADHPGLIVMRTISMLINEGYEAVHCDVADAASIDTAMRGGVNWPQGPMAIANQIGTWEVLEVLENLHELYLDDRYRPSLGFREAVWSDAN